MTTIRRIAFYAMICAGIGLGAVLIFVFGSSTGDDDHPGGSCGYYAPNPSPEPAPDDPTGGLDGGSDAP